MKNDLNVFLKGAESVICQVHPHFKCIVVGDKEEAYCGNIPVAFLNRFEKQVIDRRQLMSKTEKIGEQKLIDSLRRFAVHGTLFFQICFL